MEEKCKILEATQEDMGVMDGALKVYGFCSLFFVLSLHSQMCMIALHCAGDRGAQAAHPRTRKHH
jgi:hypothetical protein